MKIRLLKKKDIKKAAQIVGINYSKEYKLSSIKELKDAFGNASIKPKYYVAEEQGEILGFAGFIQSWMDYNIYQIFWVNVHPAKQGQGIGKKLVGKIIQEIKKKKNANLVLLTTTLPKYYQNNFGFKILQIFQNKTYYLMSLSLEN